MDSVLGWTQCVRNRAYCSLFATSIMNIVFHAVLNLRGGERFASPDRISCIERFNNWSLLLL